MGARARALAAGAVLLMAGACSPPKAPLEVGVKEIQTDVLLGPRETTTTTTATTIAAGPPPTTAGTAAP